MQLKKLLSELSKYDPETSEVWIEVFDDNAPVYEDNYDFSMDVTEFRDANEKVYGHFIQLSLINHHYKWTEHYKWSERQRFTDES